MATNVQIVNAALIRLGVDVINSLNQSNNRNSIIANAIFDMTRQELLRLHPWNFAVKRLSLASTVDAPAFGYAYQYPLPVDCLRVLRLSDIETDYKLEGGYILTDSSTCDIIYIRDVIDCGQFDSLFQEVFVAKLTAVMAPTLTDNSNTAQFIQVFETTLRTAKQIDGQEDSHADLVLDGWSLIGE